MNFLEALEEIRKEYPVRQMGEHYAQIELEELFDAYNYIFIGVLFENDKVILTDNADYAPLCGWEDENIPEVTEICKKHGITFNNYNLECDYRSNKDIEKYLNFLYELQERYVTD